MRTSTNRAIRHAVWVLGFSGAMAQANPLMIFGGINGVVDAVKRTSAPLRDAATSKDKPGKPRISLPGASQIERGMHREAVIALVGTPVRSVREGGRGQYIDAYEVKRNGLCALDLVEIQYEKNDGPVALIRQRCGDVTSNENRSVVYSYRYELPAVFDRVTMRMSRESALEVLGAPFQTREGNDQSTFVDVYVFGEEKALLTYTKGEKLLRQVMWNGQEMKLPRMDRAGSFEDTAAQ